MISSLLLPSLENSCLSENTVKKEYAQDKTHKIKSKNKKIWKERKCTNSHMFFSLFSLVLPRQVHKDDWVNQFFLFHVKTHIYMSMYLTNSFIWHHEIHTMKQNYLFKHIYAIWHLNYLMCGLENFMLIRVWLASKAFACKTCLEQVKRLGLYFFSI